MFLWYFGDFPLQTAIVGSSLRPEDVDPVELEKVGEGTCGADQ